MMSPLLGEKTMSKAMYTTATDQQVTVSANDPQPVTAAATAMAAADDAIVPDRYMAEALDLDVSANERLSVFRMTMGSMRATLPKRGGSARARVVLPSFMLLNLIPKAVPTR